MIKVDEIKILRQCLSLSKSDLARLLGYSRQHISNIEEGHAEMSEALQIKIIKCFDDQIQKKYANLNLATKIMNTLQNNIRLYEI